MILFGIRTYQVSSKKPLRFTAERLLANNKFSMEKQFNFRVPVGFCRQMIGNSTSTDFCNPLSRNATLFQF